MATNRRNKRPPTMRLEFPKGGRVQPEGFDALSVDQQVTVTLTGTVRELSNYPNREWDPGREVCLELSGCHFAPDGSGSLADAIEKGQRRV